MVARRTIEDRIYDQLVSETLATKCGKDEAVWVRVLPLKDETFVPSDSITASDIENLRVRTESGVEYDIYFNNYGPSLDTSEYYLVPHNGFRRVLPIGPFRYLHEAVDKLLEQGYIIDIKLD